MPQWRMQCRKGANGWTRLRGGFAEQDSAGFDRDSDERREQEDEHHSHRPAEPRGQSGRTSPTSLKNKLKGGNPSRAARPSAKAPPSTGARVSRPRTSAPADIRLCGMMPGDVADTWGDVTPSSALTGDVLDTPVGTGIERFALWFQETYAR